MEYGVEINRALYLDARNLAPGPGFDLTRRLIEGLVADLCGRDDVAGVAAE